MPEFTIEFEVYCASCGNGLCNVSESTRTRTRGEPCVRVEPCPKCIEEARKDGFHDGHTEGYSEGYENGVEGNNP